MKRIDAHVHGEPPQSAREGREFVERYRSLGIDKVVLIEDPHTVLKAMGVCGDFIIPVFRVKPDIVTPNEIETYFKMGCKGIKFIRPGSAYSDQKYMPLYRKIAELDGVAVFHTGYLAHRNYKNPEPLNILDMAPAHLDAIARQVPTLRMLMSHYGNPWWEEAWKVSYSHDNIYADLSGGTAYIRSMFLWKELLAPNGKLFLPAVEKLCFASDIHYFRSELMIEPYFDFYDTLLSEIGVSEELAERINYFNISELFKL
ncbi:MAG: amidohydrolase family protein [Firmicutes bacterium]|nr:amidohydrolase family protein [Bacillota bacterium]